MSSVFTQLLRYSPTGKTRREDFLTDVLCGVLGKRAALAVDLLSYLIPQEVTLIEGPVWIQSQVQVDGIRPDIWIEAGDQNGGRHIVVVENKVGSPEGAGGEGTGQLAQYRGLLTAEADAASTTLVYITHAWADAPSDNDVVHRRWFEIHDWLKKWLSGRDEPLVRELLELLEDWSMDITLTTADLVSATVWQTSTKARLQQILELVAARARDRLPLGAGTNWTRTDAEQYYYYRTPNVEGYDMRVEFAFDFAFRSVKENQIPSAYVALYGSDETVSCPADWEESDWDGYPWVRRISSVPMDKPWAEIYIEFFVDALDDLCGAFDLGT